MLSIALGGHRFIGFIIAQCSPRALVLFVTAGVILAGLVPITAVLLPHDSWPANYPGKSKGLGMYAWLVIAGMFAILLLQVQGDPHAARRSKNLRWLTEQLNPIVALGSALVAPPDSDVIQPVLATAELTQIQLSVAPESIPSNLPSVLYLAVESLRADILFQKVQGLEVTPHLNALAKKSILFTHAYSNSTHTDYALPSYLTSLYSLRMRGRYNYPEKIEWPVTLIYDHFSKYGYVPGVITSDNTSWSGLRYLMKTPALDIFYDSESGDQLSPIDPRDTGFTAAFKQGLVRGGTRPDRLTLKTVIPWLQKRIQSGKPYFLHTFFQETHYPYAMRAGGTELFKPCSMDFESSFLKYPIEKVENTRNAYYNAAHEMDTQLGNLLKYLEDAGEMDKVVIVLVGDHGEAFYEHGRVTHGREPYEEVIHIPCMIYAPRYSAPKIVDYPTQIIDMAPTLCALVGLPAPEIFQGINVLGSNVPAISRRDLYAVVNSAWHGRMILRAGHLKYWEEDHADGEKMLCDLLTDPQEKVDLYKDRRADAQACVKELHRWRDRQLAFYAYPYYYTKFNPPDDALPEPTTRDPATSTPAVATH